MKRLTRAGASLITHLGNGAPPKLPRHNNVIQAGLLEDRLSASLITDGRHVPDEFIQLVLKTKGLDRVMVVSDVAPAAGNEMPVTFCFNSMLITLLHGQFVEIARVKVLHDFTLFLKNKYNTSFCRHLPRCH